ncbi:MULTISPECIES: SIMPL domain-containing protein [unclassified Halomonas]|uniref:SIMPL domain-containing protein n=1 Tax=unclassified Halomonas TaxID=2609666 RepID=UPI002885663F|nr:MULTISPECIES: SIMPL domain-containing protein [unclassified Halomonas]MDT0499503.1 SIMPL domain-containing protein [Halomonas sp. PAR7]MDT0592307.1 SIMPL domain-containing protein [Halomonas sp. PAR8]
MKIFSALILAVATIVAASLIGEGLTHLRTGDRYVTVKGLAEREVEADLALWPLHFVASGTTLQQAREEARASREAILAFIERHDIDTQQVELQRLNVNDTAANPYGNNDGEQRFIINQTLMVRSTEIEQIRDTAQAVGELLDAGVVLSSDYGPSGPIYLFNHLNEIKPAMIAEATAAARESAEQFARDANADIGTLRRANQGVFEIRARDQAAGTSEEQQPIKTVRVVTTIEYYLD